MASELALDLLGAVDHDRKPIQMIRSETQTPMKDATYPEAVNQRSVLQPHFTLVCFKLGSNQFGPVVTSNSGKQSPPHQPLLLALSELRGGNERSFYVFECH